MTLNIPFKNTYVSLPERLFSKILPAPAQSANLVAFNSPLADELGIKGYDDPIELGKIFSGSSLPDGAEPIAQAYAGHQFGNFVPSLGDGRAVLLGEVTDQNGKQRDIQLKGSGRTPFSRGGDGRAWLGPILREYVVSEAMHALGIPTTRALAAATTGETILRQEGGVPGAVLTRVAASHLRIGTFQYFAARGDAEAVRALLEYAVTRHYPNASTPLEFLHRVIERQVALVSRWMGVGFIHGVMNTDNTSISGETIDYGPCAFMDSYHPATVYSSIDRMGRYAYMRQPEILVWNVAQLASSLLILEPDQNAAVETYTEVVHSMPKLLRAEWQRVFKAKIGITTDRPEDQALLENLLQIMAEQEADFTNTFRALAEGSARDQFIDPTQYDEWEVSWKTRIADEPDPVKLMHSANPCLIPRNHRIEHMITSAVAGDMSAFEEMLRAYSTPFESVSKNAHLRKPPTPDEVVRETFCGT